MMWSAMNWLSQKAGINLDDAQEVLHRNDTSYIQADSDEGTESSKENQSVTGNGGGNLATANGKRMRRSGRWAPPASISSCGSGSSHLGSISHLYHNGVSSHSLSAGTAMHSNLSGSPLTPIVVPTGVSLGPYCMGSTAAHPPVAPVMVPTGLRTPGVAGVGYRGNSVGGMMTPTVGNVGSPSKLSPTSVQWKDVSMATDINSPRFSFRIVRQAEKETEFGSRIYPTAQEKYLATKHLPKVRLHGPSKPVMTPKKLNSVPLIQLPSSPKPPSSLAPMLSNAPHLPVSASTFFSPASAPITDFRHANFFSSSIRSSADSHPVLSGLLDGTGSSVDHHSNNTCRVLDLSPADVTSLSNSSSSMSNMAVMGAIYRSSTAFSVSQQAGDDSFLENDPTSLKAVLAALNKSRPGKGVKQARLVDCDDPESKRPCAEEAAALPDMSCTGSSSSYLVGGDGEKRALDMSSCSSLDNSQGSPCAKIPRTWPSDPIFKALVSDPSVPVNQPSNVQHQVTVGVGLGGSSLLPEPDDEGSETPSKRRKVNPWLASFSSSQKMAARERGVSLKQTTHSEVDLEALDTDPESSDRSSEDSDNSSCGEKEGDTKPNSSRSSPAPTASSDALMHKEQSDIVRIGTTPHIVTLAAHRSDKNMSHTRLNRMLGMLFHLSEDEVKSSTTKEATSVSSTFALASTSKDIVPVVSLTSSLVTSTETTAAAATQSLSSGAAYSSTGTSFSLTLPAPTSVVASSVTPSSSSTAASTAASYGLAHSATLPVASSSSDSSSSVSASFTFKLPAKVQSNEKTANDPSSSTVIDGVNPLISFLAKNVPSSTSSAEPSIAASRDAQLSSSSACTNASAASPAYTFGDKHLSGGSNPLLASFSANSSTEPKKSEGFSLLAPSSTCTTSSLIASSNNAPQSSVSVASSASAVPSMFSFGSNSGISNASQLLFSGGNSATNSSTVNSSAAAASSELTATTTSATTSSSFFSFGAPSASTVTSVPSVPGTPVATTSTGSSPAKPAGFQFGMGKASAGFNSFQPQNSSTSVPTGGFSFGKPAQSSDTTVPSSTGSTFTFGTSASASTSAAPPLFTFGNVAAAAASTSAQAPGSATSAFTFGNSSFSTTSATTSTVSVTTTSASSDTSATFTFGPASSSNQQSNSSSTSASFTFTVKDKSNAALTGNSSPFTFGSTPSSTATSSGNSSSDSLFSFGKSTTVASESTTTSTTTSKTSSASLFSFGPPSTSTTSGSAFGTSVEAAGGGFGAGVTSTTASTTPQFGSGPNNVFGSMTSNTGSSSTDKSSATAGFGRFTPASNLFANVKNATSDAGENSATGKSKTVTFGTSNTVSGGSNNLFGPTTPATSSNTTNLFGQATTTTSSNTTNLFGQGTTTTSSNTTNLFGQAATTTSSNTTNLFGQASSSTAAGLFNKAVASTPSFGSSTFGQPAASADKSAAPSSVASPFQFGNSSNASTSNATFTFGSGKNNSTFGSTIQFGGASAAPASTFGAATAAPNPAPSFGSISSNPVPSFGSSTSSTPSFGSGSSTATPSFGAVASNPPAFGAAASNPTPSFGASGSSNPTPSFGSGTTLPVPAFGSSSGSAPSFGSPAPSFGTPAANQPGMFQFSGAAATPQQQQQPNAFSAGHYVLGTSMGGGQESHNVFSVGGSSSSSSTMRRPRVRAHRRNR